MGVDLHPLGWDAARAAGYSPLRRGDLRPARVSEVTDGVCSVLTAAGIARASAGGGLLGRAAADPSALPCVGDWVVVRAWPDDRATVEAVLHRRTYLAWPFPGRRPHGATSRRRPDAMARVANVDAVAVLEPWRPRPDLDRIARLRDLAAVAGLRYLVLITSAASGVARHGAGWSGTGGTGVRGSAALARATPDPVVGRPRPLPGGPDEAAALVEAALPGVAVLAFPGPYGSGTAGSGTVQVLRALAGPGRTLALFGAAGAATSPVIAALAGTAVLRPSRATDGGQVLIPLPGGGVVIDVPFGPAW